LFGALCGFRKWRDLQGALVNKKSRLLKAKVPSFPFSLGGEVLD
jgi:hypothetical protein